MYYLSDKMFTKKLLTEYLWTGKGQTEKQCFALFTKVIKLFLKVLF